MLGASNAWGEQCLGRAMLGASNARGEQCSGRMYGEGLRGCKFKVHEMPFVESISVVDHG